MPITSTLERKKTAPHTIEPIDLPVAKTPQRDAVEDTVAASQWRTSLIETYDRESTDETPRLARYYRSRIARRLAGIIRPGASVLDIGCGNGDLLAQLQPATGVGVDLRERVVQAARRRHPHLGFHRMRGEEVSRLEETFDFVVLSQTLGDIYDLRTLFRSIQSVCHAGTRLVIVHHSRIWQPALKLAEWLRLKPRSPQQNWVPSDEARSLLALSDFETVARFGMTIAPVYIPGVSAFLNRFVGNLPGIHHLGLNYVLVARPVEPYVLERNKPESVSIVVPARNEAGHIEPLLQRIPRLADRQQVIFVEGNSTDDTWSRIQEVVLAYRGPFDVSCMQQSGVGKRNAVQEGFERATGDVVMILDADISVPPEELPAFYDTLASGKAEFVNGSRLVYPMQQRAMRFLNLLGNKFFGAVFTYLLLQRFRDTLCGTKVLRRSHYHRIEADMASLGSPDPFGDFDLLFGAARLNLKIVDMPVHYAARVYGETNISRFRHGWILLRMCWFAARKIRFV